jgi:TolB-like protein/cytochrome c-type biogenesis protein CcmH/NrfG
MMEVWLGLSKSPKESLERDIELQKKALALDSKSALAHAGLGNAYAMVRQWDQSITEGEKAYALEPNTADVLMGYGTILCWSSRFDQAIPLFREAMRLDPKPPTYYSRWLAIALRETGKYDEALSLAKKAIEQEPNDMITHVLLTTIYAYTGREEEARAAAKEILRINPNFNIQGYPIGTFKDPTLIAHIQKALRIAGLPEKPPLPLPDKPSIAVLPFVNMSDDPKQEYFSDGITEEIISALSRVSGLFVIARNSTFTYKGKAISVPDVARDLGVGYILEGSVRRAGDRVRITSQLIEGKTNHHIWSETYDRELKDVFAVQDEITMKILTNVKVRLTGGEDQISTAMKRATNLQAYLKILEGIAYINESKFSEARKTFEEALSLDQKSPAYGWVAWTYLMDVWFGPTATRTQSLGKAFEYAQKCIEMDDSNEGCNRTIGHAYLLKRDYEKALYYGKRSIEMNPNSSNSATMFGWTLRSVGEYEEAVRVYERAMRLDPKSIQMPLTQLGTTYVMMRRHEEAIEACRKSIGIRPRNLAAWVTLVMAYSSLDRMEEARTAASEVLKISPNFSVEDFAKATPYKNEADREFMADALRKAGMK